VAERHFACTQCGKCCNRPPEVELGEAAALADVFVWQLLFRLYSLPRSVADYLQPGMARDQGSAEFYESKRLLGQFAAHSWNGKVRRDGRVVERTFTLTISALALDQGGGACSALGADGSCTVYGRRPLSCRSVPMHYSRGEAFAAGDFDMFLALPGHACDDSDQAPALIEAGKIVNPAILAARTEALTQSQTDRLWKQALVKEMKAGRHGLPSLRAVEENAARGALTSPLRFGWQVAVEAGLLSADECAALVEKQLEAIDRFLVDPSVTSPARASALDLRRFLSA